MRGTMVVWPGVGVVAGGGDAEEMQEEASNVADGNLPQSSGVPPVSFPLTCVKFDLGYEVKHAQGG